MHLKLITDLDQRRICFQMLLTTKILKASKIFLMRSVGMQKKNTVTEVLTKVSVALAGLSLLPQLWKHFSLSQTTLRHLHTPFSIFLTVMIQTTAVMVAG